MEFWNMAIRIIFLLQTTIGILGNFSFIFYYLILYCRQGTLKPTDLILLHIMAANALIILSFGVSNTMTAFGLKQFLNDFACIFLIFIQKFGRSVSIGSTCLLSVFQAMTISPSESCWKDYKHRAAKYIGSSISGLWSFSMLINIFSSMDKFISRNSENVTRKRDFGYCTIVFHNEISEFLYAVLVMCPEVFLSVLIAWSSMSMIIILYRHKQSVQHIRSTHGSSRTSHDSRATQNILLLFSSFLAFYTLSFVLRGCIALFRNQYMWLVNINPAISLCFPCFGHFVIMNPCSFLSRLIWFGSEIKNI
ncbi:vomeronasal type-1 receptor 4-like [Meriones unguiculatus]|uniref:vomeronasal type-1 receptor 4-like n=1 Tax=Meriones unguiculatus TaxID=10047 RepID=UPI00293E370B|nr:vomeronasal type-1 receptor 4-like [Meriones unguiculatus]